MGEEASLNGIQVCVRVRPLNDRERDAGYRNCISFDENTKQVVLLAVDKNTLLQLRGNAAKGYAFDRRYGPENNSDNIYDDCVTHLVDNLFKGYNATVLAYGQTGSGKTLTMSGGVGIHGLPENGVIRRSAEHILANVEAVKQKLKPGEAISVRAYALELYNEELRDLSSKAAAAAAASAMANGLDDVSAGGSTNSSSVRISERPCGNGRCISEVVGVNTVQVEDAEELIRFFSECFENRAVAATKMNDRSSRSHAIYTVLISRTLVDVSEGGDKVRTTVVESRFNLVDLAGSERVKRSGVTGAAFKEAVHINSGLLALGNVIVALSGDVQEPGDAAAGTSGAAAAEGPPSGRQSPVKAAKHIPYRDSKLTRLLQDSLGGNALTVLISCISSCEADFEETNSTLKYANRACRIRNQPLPNKQLLLEEDLLPLLPVNSTSGTMSVTQVQMLLAEHNRMKEVRERREAEKKEREEKRLAELRALKEAERKTPGYQRLRMAQYDDLRKKLISSHGTRALKGEICDETLTGFRKREDADNSDGAESPTRSGPSYTRPTTASAVHAAGKGRPGRPGTARTNSTGQLAAVYGTAASRRATSTCSSPVRWDGAQSPGGGATPDVLTVEHDAEQTAAEQEGAAGKCVQQQDESLQTDFEQVEQPGTPQQKQQQQQDEDLQKAVQELQSAGGSDHTSKKLQHLVDEGTCMTPHSPTSIKAFYAEDADSEEAAATGPAAKAASASAEAVEAPRTTGNAATGSDHSTGGRCSVGSSSSAFEVLQFHPAEPEQPQDTSSEVAQAFTAEPTPPPQLLARFRVNQQDTLAVFKAVSVEDFEDVASLLPANTALPAADRMTYLLARLEVQPQTPQQLSASLERVAAGTSTMSCAVGPAVGCLMATFGTSLITDCIFDFDDPEQLQDVAMEQRLELWGLQIPHTAVRPALSGETGVCSSTCSSPEPYRRASHGALNTGGSRPSTPLASCSSSVDMQQQQQQQQLLPQQSPQQAGAEGVTCWSSADRLNVSIGLMYALCNLAVEVGAVAGFCVPRPQLLRRWLQAGVRMKQVSSPAKLIYPSSAHDYSYYKSSTVAYFMIDEIKASLCRVLCPPSLGGCEGH